jgi:hypothetical protein
MYTWFNFNAQEIDLRPPLNPTNVGLSNIGISSATIFWDENSEIDLFKYSLYRNGSLLTDVPWNQTSFVDNYQFNGSATYIYQVTATDTRGNEGQLSQPVFVKGNFGELFAPYDIVINSYAAGGSLGLNWTIAGLSGLPVIEIKVFKSINPDEVYIIDQFSTGSSITINVPPTFRLYTKVSVVNAIGESELTNYTYVGDTTPSRNEIQPDRANVNEYGPLLENLRSDHSGPITILALPQETNSDVSTTESSDTPSSTSKTTLDTSTLPGTLQTNETSLEILFPMFSLLTFILVIVRRQNP